MCLLYNLLKQNHRVLYTTPTYSVVQNRKHYILIKTDITFQVMSVLILAKFLDYIVKVDVLIYEQTSLLIGRNFNSINILSFRIENKF